MFLHTFSLYPVLSLCNLGSVIPYIQVTLIKTFLVMQVAGVCHTLQTRNWHCTLTGPKITAVHIYYSIPNTA